MRIIIFVLIFLLSGCLSVSTQNMTLRDRSIESPDIENFVIIGNVSSSVSGIKSEDIILAITNSLQGQGILSADKNQAKYILNASYLKATAPTWGVNTAVSVTTAFDIISHKAKTNILSKTINSKCVSSITWKETLALALSATISSLNTYPTPSATNVRKIAVTAGSDQDKSLGYPTEGTPISSSDGYKRSIHAKECAIRKSIVTIIENLKEIEGEDGS